MGLHLIADPVLHSNVLNCFEGSNAALGSSDTTATPDVNSVELTGNSNVRRTDGKQLDLAAFSHYLLNGTVGTGLQSNTSDNYRDCTVHPSHLGEIHGSGASWATCTGFAAEGLNHIVLEYGNSSHYVKTTQSTPIDQVRKRGDYVFWEWHGTGAGFKISQMAYVNPRQPLSSMSDAFKSAEGLSDDIVYNNGGYNYLTYQEQFTDTHFYGSELCLIGESQGFGFGFEACPGWSGQH